MKVLHVIWHLGQGGAQTYLLSLLKEQLVDADIEPLLLVLGVPGALSSEFEQKVEVSYLDMRGGLDLLRLFRIPKALRNIHADLIHSHSNNLAFNTATQFAGMPVVYTEHGGGLLGGRKRDRIVYTYLSRPFCRIIAISHEMSRVMSDANSSLKDRIEVVYNGVDIDDIESRSAPDGSGMDKYLLNAEYRVGIIGRLERQKGIDIFLKVAAELCKSRDDVVFLIIGDGSLRSELEQLAHRLGISGKTFFLGFRTDALSLLKTLDLFVFTSIYEPFGLVITEAMAAGVPVVAMHERGAVPEIITNGVDGLVVNGRNPQDIADRADQLLRNESLRLEIINSARDTIRRRFTIQNNALGVKSIYQHCVRQSDGRMHTR